jgi:hypothetical protein
MVQLICLANSWKHGERCIAGIHPPTGQWLRPISDLEDGRIPLDVRLIADQEPQLLDILEIPLAATPPTYWEFECENRALLSGPWQRVGRAAATDLWPYLGNVGAVLHNDKRYVSLNHLLTLPEADRQSLQLLYTDRLIVQEIRKARGTKWQGSFVTPTDQRLTQATITDPILVDKLTFGYEPQNPCLVTVSLSLPFYPNETWQDDDPCWKLIAGVIELTNADLIWLEMQRLGWSLEQGRAYLKTTYSKQSRQQLTLPELKDMVHYLKGLPTPAI